MCMILNTGLSRECWLNSFPAKFYIYIFLIMLYVCIETKVEFHMQFPKVRIKNRSFIQFLNNPHLGIMVCNFIVNINLLINKSPNEITEENGLNKKKITFLRLFSILLDTYIHIYLTVHLLRNRPFTKCKVFHHARPDNTKVWKTS